MGQPVTWQYTLVWTPDDQASKIELYRVSSAGHRFLWLVKSRGPYNEAHAVDRILQELYTGLLELMEISTSEV
jgi:hypothetical protein